MPILRRDIARWVRTWNFHHIRRVSVRINRDHVPGQPDELYHYPEDPATHQKVRVSMADLDQIERELVGEMEHGTEYTF
jgi:hypothetical protein